MTVRSIASGLIEINLPSSPIGDVRFGIRAPAPLDSVAMDAVDRAARKIASYAGTVAEAAVSANSQLCIRCARTLMRAAMGDHAARQAVRAAAAGTPLKAGDDKRYELVDKAIGDRIQQVRLATEELAQSVGSGQIAGLVEQIFQQAAASNPWNPLYQQTGAGWPMKKGQWSDYKSCACGAPDSGQAPADMGSTDPMGQG